ncbi:MAG: hypothetical protein KAH84_02895 [Thiomargarita sp.]|nr:hypothetical protein [Thiomargarita sp.]
MKIKLEENGHIKQLVEQAVENSNKPDINCGNVVHLTKEQIEQIEQVSSALGIAFGVMLNSAVKYAIYYATSNRLSVKELDTYPKTLGTDSIKEKITAQTQFKLEKIGMQDYLSECVVTGVKLLYGKLINNVGISTKQPAESFVKHIESKTPSEKRKFAKKYVKNIGLEINGKTSGNSSIVNAIGSINGKKVVFQSNLAKTALNKKNIGSLSKMFEDAEIAIVLAIKYTGVFEKQLREQVNNDLKLYILTLNDCANTSVVFKNAIEDWPELANFEDYL